MEIALNYFQTLLLPACEPSKILLAEDDSINEFTLKCCLNSETKHKSVSYDAAKSKAKWERDEVHNKKTIEHSQGEREREKKGGRRAGK